MLGYAVEAALDVSTLAIQAGSVGILVLDEVMVEDLAVILGITVIG